MYLTGDLLLYVAVAPLAAAVVMMVLGLSRRAPERVRLFAAVALPTLLAMLVSVSLVSASVDVDGVENLNERYVFYVVPLTFVGLALWTGERLPRPGRSCGSSSSSAASSPRLCPSRDSSTTPASSRSR